MEGVVGVMKKVAEHEARRILTTELGVVTAVFPHADEGDADNYQCSVRLKHRALPDGRPMELRKVPVATPYLGMAMVPNVGDLVLVQFLGGDVNAPVVTGRLYDDEVRPPPNLKDEFLIRHKADAGGSIKLDREGRIVVTSRSEENTVTVDDERVTVTNGECSITVDFAGKKIEIVSAGDLTLSAKDGKLVLDAGQVEIRSGGDVKIDASKGALQADAREAKVKASSTVALEASGPLKVKGATIDMN